MKISWTWEDGDDKAEVGETITDVDRAVRRIAPTLAADADNQDVLEGLDVSQLKAIYISSDQAITVDTDGEGQAALSIAANSALVWTSNSPTACPFTADATKFVISTTVAGTAPTVKIRIVSDPTA